MERAEALLMLLVTYELFYYDKSNCLLWKRPVVYTDSCMANWGGTIVNVINETCAEAASLSLVHSQSSLKQHPEPQNDYKQQQTNGTN